MSWWTRRCSEKKSAKRILVIDYMFYSEIFMHMKFSCTRKMFEMDCILEWNIFLVKEIFQNFSS